MAVVGIGTDITEVSRIGRALSGHFLSRVFTDNEIALINSKKVDTQKALTAAARFAAKEALVKALGTGFSGISPRDIDTRNKESGAPFIVLSGNAKKIADSLFVCKIHVSLTHGTDYAAAFVLLEGRETVGLAEA